MGVVFSALKGWRGFFLRASATFCRQAVCRMLHLRNLFASAFAQMPRLRVALQVLRLRSCTRVKQLFPEETFQWIFKKKRKKKRIYRSLISTGDERVFCVTAW